MSDNNNNNNKDDKKKNQKLKTLNNRRVLPDISGNSPKRITIWNNVSNNNNLFNLEPPKENEIIKPNSVIPTIYIDFTKEDKDNKENKDIKPYTSDFTMTIDNLLKKIREERDKQSKIVNGLDKYNLKLPALEDKNENKQEDKGTSMSDLIKNCDNDYNNIFRENGSSPLWRNPFYEREKLLNPDNPYRSILSRPASTSALPRLRAPPALEPPIEYEFVDVEVEIECLQDLLKMIEKYPMVSNVKYNINMQAMHNIKEPLQALNNMVGMNNLKINIVDQILYFVQDLHTIKSKKSDDFMHTVIYGPPGTGKTETAKIMGQIYSKLGVLKKKSFKKVTRSDFVAGYLGQTALKTRDLIKDNLGGVLFIDEAYALGNSEKRDSFAKEALDTLCEGLSDYKDQIMVIIAGYEEELKTCFFSYNKGLESRFTWRFQTEDYKPNELMLIFKKKVEESGWSTHEKALSEDWFKDKMDNFKYYGRDMETLFSKVKISHSRRVFCKPKDQKTIITKKDMNSGFKKYLENGGENDKKDDNEAIKTMYM